MATKKTPAKKTTAIKNKIKTTIKGVEDIAKAIVEEVTPAKIIAPAELRSPEKTAKKKPVPDVTTIIAVADIGWGNTLYIRGEGAGLSWEIGTPMTNKGMEEWIWATTSNDPVIEFKFVLNDKFWSLGENGTAARGETNRTYPIF